MTGCEMGATPMADFFDTITWVSSNPHDGDVAYLLVYPVSESPEASGQARQLAHLWGLLPGLPQPTLLAVAATVADGRASLRHGAADMIEAAVNEAWSKAAARGEVVVTMGTTAYGGAPADLDAYLDRILRAGGFYAGRVPVTN
jgi:hypothetical protein